MKCVEVNEEDISRAYKAVQSDTDAVNWLLLGYTGDRSNTLAVAATGEGGLEELKQNLKDDQAGFAYVRMTIANDELSMRAKFAFISWCGAKVGVMRKAKLSVHGSEVETIITYASVKRHFESLDDVKEEELVLDLRKAAGANYDRQASNY